MSKTPHIIKLMLVEDQQLVREALKGLLGLSEDIAIVGEAPMMRATLITRVAKDAWRTTQAWDTVAPRLVNFPEPSKFTF